MLYWYRLQVVVRKEEITVLNFLEQEGVSPRLIEELKIFRQTHPLPSQAYTSADASASRFDAANSADDTADYASDSALAARIRMPRYFYYGKDIWEEALAALLCGEHLLLTGPKATGKNVFAENLAAAFGRPLYNISLSINTDAASLIGSDTFQDGAVTFREGPICRCAKCGGFGVLDEINMAKNEALAVLHEALDFRGSIDIPGYERITLDDSTRFVATMNYGYAGTRELNEALASRFVVIDMPSISEEYLTKLLLREFPSLTEKWCKQFCLLFQELQAKCQSAEISAKALDLRGLLSAIRLMDKGLAPLNALRLGIGNKLFDPYERKLVDDLFKARISKKLDREAIFSGN